MQPDIAAEWREEALEHIFIALAASDTLAANLIFKGARVLNARLQDGGRRSLDIDANLIRTFQQAFPERAQQARALEEATTLALRHYFRSQNPSRYDVARVRVVLKPVGHHPWGWEAFTIEIGLIDRQHPSVIGLPRLTVDIAAPEDVGQGAVAPLQVDGHDVAAYTTPRIAGEKLRAFLTSLPAYRSKLGGRPDTVRVKDLYDLARIDRHAPVANDVFWQTAAHEFRIACSSRYVDCHGLDTFAESLDVTRVTYSRDASLADISFDEAWNVVAKAMALFHILEIVPFVVELPPRHSSGSRQ